MEAERSDRRRERIEPNIYRRRAADGREVFEVGFRDATRRQRWRTVDGGITAARSVRNDVRGRKVRNERVSTNPRPRFGQAADAWLAGPVATLRPATRAAYTNASETHLRPRFGRIRLDGISGDDVAKLVRDLRNRGAEEWTLRGMLSRSSPLWGGGIWRIPWRFGGFGVLGSCLPSDHDGGVRGEFERFGLQFGGLGEFLEGAGVSV